MEMYCDIDKYSKVKYNLKAPKNVESMHHKKDMYDPVRDTMVPVEPAPQPAPQPANIINPPVPSYHAIRTDQNGNKYPVFYNLYRAIEKAVVETGYRPD